MGHSLDLNCSYPDSFDSTWFLFTTFFECLSVDFLKNSPKTPNGQKEQFSFFETTKGDHVESQRNRYGVYSALLSTDGYESWSVSWTLCMLSVVDVFSLFWIYCFFCLFIFIEIYFTCSFYCCFWPFAINCFLFSKYYQTKLKINTMMI